MMWKQKTGSVDVLINYLVLSAPPSFSFNFVLIFASKEFIVLVIHYPVYKNCIMLNSVYFE